MTINFGISILLTKQNKIVHVNECELSEKKFKMK